MLIARVEPYRFLTCCSVVLSFATAAVADDATTTPDPDWRKVASPSDLGWSADQLDEARAFAETLDTTALMIVQDGIVVDEWGPTALPLRCHSVRKSLLSALYGQYVDSGQIDLEQTLEQLGINDSEPSLTDTERLARIGDLLKARSGIYHPALYETRAMAERRPLRDAHEPDTFWYYNNWDFNTAGSIFENLGQLLSLILAARPEREPDETSPAEGNPASPPASAAARPEFDTLIRNGEVIDGTGSDRFRADVAILDGVVAGIGMLPNATAERVINADGKLIAPGFIDLHSHAEQGLVSDDPARRSAPNLITQGITTVVVNQDGGGPLGLVEQRKSMRQLGTGLNVVQVIGHGTIRRQVMGDDHQRPATAAEIEQMREHLRNALAGGAFGMSAGLEYVPGRWSTTREMEALAGTIAEWDGVYIVHERSSGSHPMWFLPSRDSANQPSMLDNLRELILIAESTGVTTVATHIKARGTDFWGSSGRMNELIREARADGLSFFADQYPYNTSGSDGRIVLIPSWAASESGDTDAPDFALPLETVLSDVSRAADLRRDIEFEIARRGGAENILIIEHPDEDVVGLSLAELAASLDTNPVEAAISLQLQGDRSRRGGARLRAFSMSEQDVEAFAQTPWTATSSDAGIALPQDGPVHPRFYGAFPRKIRHYAIDRGLISIEEAVRVSTSLPAGILQLENRGVIQQGAHADLVVFDPEQIRDTADAFNPHQYAEGIDYVFVNGTMAVDRQRWLGCLSGRVLTRQPTQGNTDAASTAEQSESN